jgi:cholesterol 7-dehydrogenase
LAVFRGETDGKVGVLDAYCPHMGANMAVGGKVVGESLVCPFHLWEYAKDGKVTRIPYADKVPDVAKTTAWPVTEYHGQICIYYDAEGRDPPYELKRSTDIDSGAMVYHGNMEKVVKMHIQEFAENSVDFMHFAPLHGQMKLPWVDIYIPGLQIIHKANWVHGEV